MIRQTNLLQRLGDAGSNLLRRLALAAQAVADVARHIHMREQGIGLEHHVHRPAVRRNPAHVLAVDQEAAFIRRLEARQHAHQGGLAAARAAQQGEQLTTPNLEIDTVDRDDGAEALADARDGDDRIGAQVTSPFSGPIQRPVFTAVQSRVRSRVWSAVPAVMV